MNEDRVARLTALEQGYSRYEDDLLGAIANLQYRYKMLMADSWYKTEFPANWRQTRSALGLSLILADRHLRFVRAVTQRVRWTIADEFGTYEGRLIMALGGRLAAVLLGNPFYNPDQDRN